MATIRDERTTAHNSTYKKLAVQWLNEALCFVSSSVLVDSFELRNPALRIAAAVSYKLQYKLQNTDSRENNEILQLAEN